MCVREKVCVRRDSTPEYLVVPFRLWSTLGTVSDTNTRAADEATRHDAPARARTIRMRSRSRESGRRGWTRPRSLGPGRDLKISAQSRNLNHQVGLAAMTSLRRAAIPTRGKRGAQFVPTEQIARLLHELLTARRATGD